MRRWITALTMAAALCIPAAAVQAGPKCCASKKSKEATVKARLTAAGDANCAAKAKTSCCKADAFPTIERKFVVAGEIYDTEEQAWQGLANAAERYVKQYASIACVVDGKVIYCSDKSDACCKSGDAAKVVLAAAKSDGRCKGAAKTAVLAKAEEKPGCCKAKQAKLATADEKSGCSKAETVALVSADGKKDLPACCKAKLACCEAAKKAGKKGNCCAGEAKVASDKSSHCTKAKTAALVSADDDKPACAKAREAAASGCHKAKTASVVKADEKKAGCCKAKAKQATLASADEKSGCSKAKTATLVKAEEKAGCCKAKQAKLASDESMPACCKAKLAKLASADDKAGCCKAKAAALAKADDAGCCKSKNVTYRVAGRDYDTWEKAVAARDAALAAMNNVKMAYLVNGTRVDCASKVCPKAKAAGQVKFVVGELTTGCELHARVELAKAQLEAVQSAMAGDKVASR